MKTIKCNCGKDILVDDSDYDTVNAYSWYCTHSGRVLSAVVGPNGKIDILLSSLLIQTEQPIIDHKDLNTHNNQRENLRPASHSENSCNRKIRVDSTTGYKGVSFHPKRKAMWRMSIMKNGKLYSSYHSTIEAAAIAYDKLARELHGEFAHLNFP